MVHDETELAAEIEEQNALFKEIAKEVAGFFASAKNALSKWTVVKDVHGKPYYWNEATDETSWEKPPGFEEPNSQLISDFEKDGLEGERLAQQSLQSQLQQETQYWINSAKEQDKRQPPPALPTAPEAPREVKRPAPPASPPPPSRPSLGSEALSQLESSLAEEKGTQRELERQIREEGLAWIKTAREQAPVPMPEVKRAPPPSPKLPPPEEVKVARPPPPSPGPLADALTQLARNLAEEKDTQQELLRQIREENGHWVNAAKQAAALPSAPARVEEVKFSPPPSPKLLPQEPPKVSRPPPPSPGPRAPDSGLEQSLRDEKAIQEQLAREIRAETVGLFEAAKRELKSESPPVPSERPVERPLPPRPAPPSPAPPRVDSRADDDILAEKAEQEILLRQIRVESAKLFEAARQEQAILPAPVPAPPSPRGQPLPPRPAPPSPSPRSPYVDMDLQRSLAEEKDTQQELQRQIRKEELALFEAAKRMQIEALPPRLSSPPPIGLSAIPPRVSSPPPRASPPPPRAASPPPRVATPPPRVAPPPRLATPPPRLASPPPRSPPPPRPAGPPQSDAEAENLRAEKSLQDDLVRQIRAEEMALFEAAKKSEVSSPWVAVVDGEGKTYYWNQKTDQTSWDKPADFVESEAAKEKEKEDAKQREELEVKRAAEEKTELEAKREQEEKEQKAKRDVEEKALEQKALAEKQSPWEEVRGADGKPYYWNKLTDQTSWDKPSDFDNKEGKIENEEAERLEREKQAREAEDEAVRERRRKEEIEAKLELEKEQEKAKGWKAVKNADGETYYWNQVTDETSWQKPAGFVDDQEEEELKKKKAQEEEDKRREKQEKDLKEKEDEEKYQRALAAARELEQKHSLPPPPQDAKSLPPPPSEAKTEGKAPPPRASPPPPRASPPPPLTIPTTPSAPPRAFPSSSPSPPPPREGKELEQAIQGELEEQKKLKGSIGQLESNFMIEAETRMVTVPDDKKGPWVAVKDADGGMYYWNQDTGATTWLRPEDFEGPVIDPNAPSPKGEAPVEEKHSDTIQLSPEEFTRHLEQALNTTAWKQVQTPDGDKYWWNQDTGETSWLEPERVQVDPIISKALELTNRREVNAQRAEARARLKKELEQLDNEEKQQNGAGPTSLVEQKNEMTIDDDDVEHLGQAAELLMASMGTQSADRRLIQELEGKIEVLTQANVALMKKLITCHDNLHAMDKKVIGMLENQAKAGEDLRKREEEILQNAQQVASQIIAAAAARSASMSAA